MAKKAQNKIRRIFKRMVPMLKHKLYRVLFILVLFILFFSGAFITMEYRARSLAKDVNDSRSYYFIIGEKILFTRWIQLPMRL